MKSKLYDLIHSLDKNEKGYIVKELKKSKSKFLDLFNQICSSKEFNDKKIKELLNSSYIGKHYAFSKSYLYDFIIKKMIQYKSNKKDVHYYFSSLEFLYNKGLYKICSRTIKHITLKSKQNNDYLSILRCCQFAKTLNTYDLDRDLFLSDLLNNEQLFIENQKITTTYENILLKVKKISLKGGVIDANDNLWMEEILNSDFLNDNKMFINDYCKIVHYEIVCIISLLLNKFKDYRSHFETLHQLMLKSPPHIIHEYKKIEIILMLLKYGFLIRDFDYTNNNLNLFESLLKMKLNLNKKEITKLQSLYYIYKTHFLLNKKQLSDTTLFEEMKVFFNKNKDVLDNEVFILTYGNIVIFEFLKSNYIGVIKTADYILNVININTRADILISIMSTQLIAYYEINKIDTFEYRLSTFKNYLLRYKIKEKTWLLFLNYFQKLLKGENYLSSTEQLLVELNQLEHNRILADLEFLIDWLKNKVNKDK